MIKFMSLFAGIGGFDLGFERAGMTPVAQCEIDPWCQKILKKHWPDVPLYDDVTKLTWEKLQDDGIKSIELICGGYPCQPFSLAGKRNGAEDDRHLWPEMFRLVQEIRPTWVVGENVAGHISMGIDQVLSDLEAQGYTCQTFIIPACAVDAHHRRDRLWIVAHTDSLGKYARPGQVQGENEQLQQRNNHAKPFTKGKSSPILGNTGSNSLRNELRSKRTLDRDMLDSSGRHEKTNQSTGPSEDVSDTNIINDDNGRHESSPLFRKQSQSSVLQGSKQDVSNAESSGCKKLNSSTKSKNTRLNTRATNQGRPKWPAEPRVGRVANGIPHRVDRLRGLGNAVVPQIPEIIGRAIMEVSE